VAPRAFDMLCERAVSREVLGRLLKDKQTIQNWIADSAAEMQAARLMTLHAAWKIDRHGSSAARTDVSLIKFFGVKVLHDVVDRALQIHGALGYSTDLPLEAMYRYARHSRFVDGADEVHRESVARQLLKSIEAAPGGIPSEHVPTRREAARRKFAHILEPIAEPA
jgi:acyl-CoA dehydrogenase